MNSRNYTLTEIMLNEWRAEGAQTFRLGLVEGTGLWLDTGRRATLLVVIEGTVPITLSDGTVRQLAMGDCALNFYGERQLLGGNEEAETFDVPSWDSFAMPDRIEELRTAVATSSKPLQADILVFVLVVPNVGSRTFANRAVPELVVFSDRPNRRPLPLGMDPRRLTEMLDGPGANALATQFGAWMFALAQREMATKIIWGEGVQAVRTPTSSQIAAILRELRTWPARQWTVEMMARTIGLSRSTFVSAFTAATGASPMAFLTRQRMEMAARLMGSQVLTIQQVAQMSGYEVYNSFARAFKRHWGTAPVRFRRKRMTSTDAGDG